jgi:hypothetical protein
MKSHLVAAALVVAAALPVSAAPPPGFTFTQAGYANGTLNGWFTGVDANADGFLSTSELSDFQFAFFATDGSSFQSLAVPVDQMFEGGGFLFKLGGTVLGDDPGEFIAAGITGVHTAGFSYTASSAGGTLVPPADFSIGVTSTVQLVQVVPVPEPATGALMLIGLAALAGVARRPERRAA